MTRPETITDAERAKLLLLGAEIRLIDPTTRIMGNYMICDVQSNYPKHHPVMKNTTLDERWQTTERRAYDIFMSRVKACKYD